MKRAPIDYAWQMFQVALMVWMFSMLGLSCYAQSVCAPRTGTWTFAAGTVCYGDER